MEILKNYIKDAENGEESLEMLEQYINDYPMGERLTGFEFDFAASLIKEENLIVTQNEYKVGFVKGKSFVYFIYYKKIPLLKKPMSAKEDFLIHKCNTLVYIINIQDFAEKILLYLKNNNDRITRDDLNALICNYLTLVYESVENYQKKNEEMTKWFEEKTGSKSEE